MKPSRKCPAASVIDAYGVAVETSLPAADAGFRASQGKETRISILSGCRLTSREQDAVHAARMAKGNEESWTLNLEGNRVLQAWADGLELLIAEGGTVVEVNYPPAHLIEDLTAFIINFAVGSALAVQGEETLHGTMLSIAGVGIGIVGPCDAGKSSLAACLVGQGARLVTDDIMRLDFGDGALSVHRGSDCLKLRKDAWQAFLPHSPRTGLFHPDGDKLLIRAPASGDATSLSALHMLVYLDRSPEAAAAPSLQEVVGAEKFELLAPSTMDVGSMVSGPSVQHFAFVGRVAASVPLYRMRCGHAPDAVAEMAEVILQFISRRRL